MNFNTIDAVSKIGHTNTALKFNKKDIEDSVEQNATASKTFLSESSSQKVGVKDPYQELSDFMKMTDAQKMQYLWLKKHGISQEEFDAMSGEDKQKLVEKMQEELKAQMKNAIESPEKTSLSLA
jgi:predicted flavoprotein YhiN